MLRFPSPPKVPSASRSIPDKGDRLAWLPASRPTLPQARHLEVGELYFHKTLPEKNERTGGKLHHPTPPFIRDHPGSPCESGRKTGCSARSVFQIHHKQPVPKINWSQKKERLVERRLLAVSNRFREKEWLQDSSSLCLQRSHRDATPLRRVATDIWHGTPFP